jgi:PleD family two-component response regulator
MKSLSPKNNLLEAESNGQINVLLIGNNPLEMTQIYDYLRNLKKKKVIADFCFDLKDSIKRVLNVKPNYILLDDTLSKKYIREFVDKVRKNKKTQDIPIALLKSSNKYQIVSSGIHDFLLKEHLTSDRLWKSIINAIRLKRTQRIINYTVYKKKSEINRLFQKVRNNLRDV